MTTDNFAEVLRLKAKAAKEKDSTKTWWQTFAPRLIDASERGYSDLALYELLTPQQIDLCREKGLTVNKTPRHKHPTLTTEAWYIISWGTK